ncbi:dTDP-4-dehydrorhamnose reductase [Paenibacillus macerans]|uniref:dTDP-4-dehydrorhamnose reductase n=1 Tax=Paenibacillus macerans TaxID=44252 RepID=UPI00203E839E|nr:dTDP-4-dehydrorhamnose reductase [Paenibacillus macerans]MCM3701152.1 dTDP-4-dehydrorhamnose reductase [Paenibacillus macerans]
MKVLVTGAKGQLGYDVVRFLKKQEMEFSGLGIDDLDVTDLDATARLIRSYLPDTIIHCAAYTDVDRAESEVEKCRAINVDSTANIASLCNEINAKLVYISTDYVFPGEGSIPHEVNSNVGPISVYGQSKLDGERAVLEELDKHFIIRTSWAFGSNGNNFVKTMLKLSREFDAVNVVSDQVGSPTYTYDLAQLIVEMLKTEKYGIYHATNEGYCSWAEFATEIFNQAGKKARVNFIQSEQYQTKATRPKNSMLSKLSLDLAGFNRLPDWKDALNRYLKTIKLKD